MADMAYKPTRKFVVTRVKAGVLAVANGVAFWGAQCKGRVLGVEVSLGNIGAVSGQTTVDVKKNGTSILSAPISIAFNAAQNFSRKNQSSIVGITGQPGGQSFVEDDVFRFDVTAIPGTASQDLSVDLLCAVQDS